MPATGLGPVNQEALLDALRKRIDLTVERMPDDTGNGTPNAGSTTYGVTYQDTERARALKLVRMLVSALINETLGGSRQGSEHAQAFLKAQIADYEKRLQAAEDRLAALKSQHVGLLTMQHGGLFDQLQHEIQAIEDLNTSMVVAQTQRDALERQLHGDAAVTATSASPVVGPNGVMVGGDTVSQIELVQGRLNQLLLKYTDRYPDVIAAKEQLAALQRRRSEEIAALRRGDVNAAALSGASANPVYQSILLARNKVDVTIAELRAELKEHQQKANELSHLLNTTPELEAQ